MGVLHDVSKGGGGLVHEHDEEGGDVEHDVGVNDGFHEYNFRELKC